MHIRIRLFASFRGYGLTAISGKICTEPPHSHSIVSETFKLLFLLTENLRPPQFTVKSAVKNVCLRTIDADSRRKFSSWSIYRSRLRLLSTRSRR